ncbi:MAG: ABC transporter permease [Pirellulales bacterium]|nr:ABC transporter permease [Pirellulales bacterium]
MRTIQIGVKNLLLHKLRSLLTVLGVILGVGSVISMLAIGEGSKREALEQIRQLGADNVIIRSVKPGQNGEAQSSISGTQQQESFVLEYGLEYKDLDRLKATLPTIRLALPTVLRVTDARYAHRWIPNARILGTIPEFFKVKNLRLHRGRFITRMDNYKTKNVAVLAAGAAEQLFGFEDPLGKPVMLGSDIYTVVGILAPQTRGHSASGRMNSPDYNRDIYVPLSAGERRFGEFQSIRGAGSMSFERTQLHEITLTVTNASLVSQTAAMARKILLKNHPDAADFEIQVPLELLRQAEQEKRIWNLVLGCIAGISLLVGGIGIMNIMLASVTERTREIGIRRSLGAKRRDITLQFLVESVLLSAIGGLLGIALGIAIPHAVSQLSDIKTILSWWSILLAFGISCSIGVIFGIYPARRAALMNPIEALRHE